VIDEAARTFPRHPRATAGAAGSGFHGLTDATTGDEVFLGVAGFQFAATVTAMPDDPAPKLFFLPDVQPPIMNASVPLILPRDQKKAFCCACAR